MTGDRDTRKRIARLQKEIGRLAQLSDRIQYEDMLRFQAPDVDVRVTLAQVEAQMAEYQAELERLEAADV